MVILVIFPFVEVSVWALVEEETFCATFCVYDSYVMLILQALGYDEVCKLYCGCGVPPVGVVWRLQLLYPYFKGDRLFGLRCLPFLRVSCLLRSLVPVWRLA